MRVRRRAKTVVMFKHLAHVRPFSPQPVTFVTVVTHRRAALLANPVAFGELTTSWRRSAEIDGWFVGDYLIMPDHVHLFARSAFDAKVLSTWIGSWKSISARRLKPTLRWKDHLWQDDYFDRFLRSGESYSEKWTYVANNPVRKGLCRRVEDWPWKGRLYDLTF